MFKSQLEPPSENFVETQIFVENIFDTVKKAREAKTARSLAESKLAHYDYSFDFSPSKRKKTRKNAKSKAGKANKGKTTPKKKPRKPRTPKDSAEKKKKSPAVPKTPRKYTKRAKVKPQNDIDDEEAAFILSSISQRSFDSFYNRLNGSTAPVTDNKIQIPLEAPTATQPVQTSPSSVKVEPTADHAAAYHHVLLDHNYWIVEPKVEPQAAAQVEPSTVTKQLEVNNNKLPSTGDNAVKKRWLRQATTESTVTTPETSPNDMMKAPLKKRRVAREIDDNNEINMINCSSNRIAGGCETDASRIEQTMGLESNNNEAIKFNNNNYNNNNSFSVHNQTAPSMHPQTIVHNIEQNANNRSVIQSPMGLAHGVHKNNLTFGIQMSSPVDVNAIYGRSPENLFGMVKAEGQQHAGSRIVHASEIKPLQHHPQIMYEEKLIKLEPGQSPFSPQIDFRPTQNNNIVEVKFNDKLPQIYGIKTEPSFDHVDHKIKLESPDKHSMVVDGKLQQLLDGKIQRNYRENYFVDQQVQQQMADQKSYGQLYQPKITEPVHQMPVMDGHKNHIIIHTDAKMPENFAGLYGDGYPKIHQASPTKSPTKIGQLKGFSSPTKIQISPTRTYEIYTKNPHENIAESLLKLQQESPVKLLQLNSGTASYQLPVESVVPADQVFGYQQQQVMAENSKKNFKKSPKVAKNSVAKVKSKTAKVKKSPGKVKKTQKPPKKAKQTKSPKAKNKKNSMKIDKDLMKNFTNLEDVPLKIRQNLAMSGELLMKLKADENHQKLDESVDEKHKNEGKVNKVEDNTKCPDKFQAVPVISNFNHLIPQFEPDKPLSLITFEKTNKIFSEIENQNKSKRTASESSSGSSKSGKKLPKNALKKLKIDDYGGERDGSRFGMDDCETKIRNLLEEIEKQQPSVTPPKLYESPKKSLTFATNKVVTPKKLNFDDKVSVIQPAAHQKRTKFEDIYTDSDTDTAESEASDCERKVDGKLIIESRRNDVKPPGCAVKPPDYTVKPADSTVNSSATFEVITPSRSAEGAVKLLESALGVIESSETNVQGQKMMECTKLVQSDSKIPLELFKINSDQPKPVIGTDKVKTVTLVPEFNDDPSKLDRAHLKYSLEPPKSNLNVHKAVAEIGDVPGQRETSLDVQTSAGRPMNLEESFASQKIEDQVLKISKEAIDKAKTAISESISKSNEISNGADKELSGNNQESSTDAMKPDENPSRMEIEFISDIKQDSLKPESIKTGLKSSEVDLSSFESSNHSKSTLDSIIIAKHNLELSIPAKAGMETKTLSKPGLKASILVKTGIESSVPSQSGPETSLPPKSGPETSIPLKSGPESSVPPRSGPDPSIPSKSGPETSIPLKFGPESSVPSKSGPDPSIPSKSGPETSIPLKFGPETSILPKSGPETSIPTKSDPETPIPSKSGPETSIPSKSGPETPILSRSGPETSTLSKSGPETSTLSKSGPEPSIASDPTTNPPQTPIPDTIKPEIDMNLIKSALTSLETMKSITSASLTVEDLPEKVVVEQQVASILEKVIPKTLKTDFTVELEAELAETDDINDEDMSGYLETVEDFHKDSLEKLMQSNKRFCRENIVQNPFRHSISYDGRYSKSDKGSRSYDHDDHHRKPLKMSVSFEQQPYSNQHHYQRSMSEVFHDPRKEQRSWCGNGSYENRSYGSFHYEKIHHREPITTTYSMYRAQKASQVDSRWSTNGQNRNYQDYQQELPQQAVKVSSNGNFVAGDKQPAQSLPQTAQPAVINSYRAQPSVVIPMPSEQPVQQAQVVPLPVAVVSPQTEVLKNATSDAFGGFVKDKAVVSPAVLPKTKTASSDPRLNPLLVQDVKKDEQQTPKKKLSLDQYRKRKSLTSVTLNSSTEEATTPTISASINDSPTSSLAPAFDPAIAEAAVTG